MKTITSIQITKHIVWPVVVGSRLVLYEADDKVKVVPEAEIKGEPNEQKVTPAVAASLVRDGFAVCLFTVEDEGQMV
jgi:hypothetical protein